MEKVFFSGSMFNNYTMESLDSFAGMFIIGEIAWIVAKYPNLSGKCLCAYNKEDAMLNLMS